MLNTSINTINRNFKTFDDFISYHFDGLSAHTLYQTLTKDLPMAKQLFSNIVYVSLYNIYTDNNVCDADLNTFENILKFVFDDEYVTEEEIHTNIIETAYCLHFGYNAVNLEWLKNNAYKWFSKHMISLNTFLDIARL